MDKQTVDEFNAIADMFGAYVTGIYTVNYGDFIYDVQDVLDDLANQHMIDRDGDPTPTVAPVTKEPDPDARGKGLGLANRYSAVNNQGKWWLK